MTGLSIQNLGFSYKNCVIFSDFSLQVPAGGLVCLSGPSGSGKSTLLRLIAGFEQPHSGTIQIGDQTVAVPGGGIPPEKRGVGMVFQDSLVFPHLTVSQNIGFGLHDQEPQTAKVRIGTLLAQFELNEVASQYPDQLSGGQRQRVAIAQAIARNPSVLLLDEPFSHLDADLCAHLMTWVCRLFKDQNQTVVWVTHNPDEIRQHTDQFIRLGN